MGNAVDHASRAPALLANPLRLTGFRIIVRW
jgi:hypothetical protein